MGLKIFVIQSMLFLSSISSMSNVVNLNVALLLILRSSPLVLREMWPRCSVLRRLILSSIYFYYIEISVI